MGKIYVRSSGLGSLDSGDFTANPDDVIKGKLAGVKDIDEPVAGTLELTGDATEVDVVSGKGFYTTDPKAKCIGGLTDKTGAVQIATPSLDTVNSRIQMVIPANGKYTTSSKLYATYATIRNLIGLTADKIPKNLTILGQAGSYTSDANATAPYISNGKTSYVNGKKITGSLATQGGSTTTPGTANKTIVTSPRHVTGNIVVAGSGNLTAGNIKKGVNIFGVTGTWEGFVPSARDIYNYGTQRVPWFSDASNSSSASTVDFESNQINLFARGDSDDLGATYRRSLACTRDSVSLTGFNTITMIYNVITVTKSSMIDIELGVHQNRPLWSDTPDSYTRVNGTSLTTGQKTMTLNVSAINAARYIGIRVTAGGYRKDIRIYVYKVSLS